MKRLHLIAIVSLITFALSCTKKSDPPEPVDKSGNLAAAGASANEILSNAEFDKLKIEIAYVAGFRPTEEAMTEFINYLRAHTFKENIELVFLELPSPDEEELSIEEIADLEATHRTVYNEGKTLGLYIYFADAQADDDEPDEGLVTLGAVYRNTSMIIHEATVRRLAGLSFQISIADVETATLNHEFGHLFGLVDLGSPQVNEHEDTEAPNHCNVEGCLMRAELQFGGSSSGKNAATTAKNELKPSCSLSGKSVLKMLENHTAKGLANAVPLDAECLLDLEANGGR